MNHTSREMSRLVKLARTFAETGQPILVYGEVGSGKSLFAQSIHNASPCSKGPFVTFDCAAHSPEQEAALSRAGKAADTGTLYLDNLDQLTPGGQRVLCRLLREGVQKRWRAYTNMNAFCSGFFQHTDEVRYGCAADDGVVNKDNTFIPHNRF